MNCALKVHQSANQFSVHCAKLKVASWGSYFYIYYQGVLSTPRFEKDKLCGLLRAK